MAMAAILSPSCDSFIYDDLDPCPQGVKLRFIYDMNMEFANAFPSQVDCLTLLVYDSDGNYLDSYVQPTNELLSNENWRLTLDLEPGDYIFEAWGGMECESSSFHFNNQPSSQSLQSLQVAMDADVMTAPVGTQLHPLFFGQLSMTVPEESTDYTEGTVKMMKDTNNIRIVLQNVNGSKVDNEDFTFAITDDNTLLNFENEIISQPTYTYNPWTRGQSVAGANVVDGERIEVAYAEFSTSRFVTGSTARLEINRVSDGKKVLSIPLVDYLLLLKSQEFDWMQSQEFLDRESRWNVIFFLDSNSVWLKTEIVVNGWTVRINNIEA